MGGVRRQCKSQGSSLAVAFLSLGLTAIHALSEPQLLLVSRWTNAEGATVTLREDHVETFHQEFPGFENPQPLFYIYSEEPPHDRELARCCVRWRRGDPSAGGDWVFETEENAPDSWWIAREHTSKTMMGWGFSEKPSHVPPGYIALRVSRRDDRAHHWLTEASLSNELGEEVCWALGKSVEAATEPGAGAPAISPDDLPDVTELPLVALPLGYRETVVSERIPPHSGRIGPVHESRSVVALETIDRLWISAFEVSQHLFDRVMVESPFIADAIQQLGPGLTPASRVSPQEAEEFCSRLTLWCRQNHRIPETYHFRLPRHAEFSVALTGAAENRSTGRLELGLPSPFEQNETPLRRTATLWSDIYTKIPFHRILRPSLIGENEPNGLGVYDLIGNQEEILTNSSGELYYRGGGSLRATDKTLPWAASYRRITGDYRSDLLGFRFVLAPLEERSSNRISEPMGTYTIRDDVLSREWTFPSEEPIPDLVDFKVANDGSLWFALRGAFGRIRDGQLDIYQPGSLGENPHHVVTSIAADRAGGVWLLHDRVRQITRYANGRFHSEPIPHHAQWLDTLSLGYRGNSVWLRSYDQSDPMQGRLHRIAADDTPNGSLQFDHFPFPSLVDQEILNARETGPNTLLVTTATDSYTLTDIDEAAPPMRTTATRDPFSFIASAPSGQFVAHSQASLLLGVGAQVLESVPIPNAFAVDADSRGEILRDGSTLVQIAGALLRYHNGHWEHIPVPDGQTGASLFDVDARDGFWVGANANIVGDRPHELGQIPHGRVRRGLWRLHLPKVLNLTEQSGIAPGAGWSACRDGEGGVWLITNGGLTHWTTDGAILTYEGPPDWLRTGRGFNCLTRDSKGRLWIGLRQTRYAARPDSPDSPILVFENQHWRHVDIGVTRYQARWINTIYEDAHGILWFGAKQGLIRYSPREETRFYTTEDGLPSNDIRILIEDAQGHLWIGTQGAGLVRYNQGNQTFQTYTTEDGLSGNYVISVLKDDADGALWLGTENGITRLKGDTLTPITSEDGFPGPNVNQLFFDHQRNLWTGGATGIFKIPRASIEGFLQNQQDTVTYEAFGAIDGMQTLDTNGESWPAGCVTPKGDLIFPTSTGFAVIRPDEMGRRTKNRTQAYVRQLLVHADGADSEPIPLQDIPDEPIRLLPAQSRSIELQIGATDLEAPESIHFRYRLEGLSDQWRDIGPKRSVIFASLPPGTYTFTAEARNHNHVWGPPSDPLVFSVQPSIHQTRWFPWCASLFLLTLGFLIHGTWTRNLRRQAELRRRDHFNQQRNQITRDIHDEIGADVIRMSLAAENLKNGASRDPQQVVEIAARIQHIAKETMRDLRRILWTANPQKDTSEQLINYLIQLFDSALVDHPIQRHIDAPASASTIALPPDTRHHIALIVQEALHNLAKHANARNAYLTIRNPDKNLVIQIEDDGNGIRDTSAPGNGIKNMRQRANLIGAEFNIQSLGERGLRIVLTIHL